jgi:hypothetical protein
VGPGHRAQSNDVTRRLPAGLLLTGLSHSELHALMTTRRGQRHFPQHVIEIIAAGPSVVDLGDHPPAIGVLRDFAGLTKGHQERIDRLASSAGKKK